MDVNPSTNDYERVPVSTYKIEIPESIVEDLKIFAKRNNNIPLKQALARAFALVSIANTASEQHHTLAVIHKEQGKDPVVVGEITGV